MGIKTGNSGEAEHNGNVVTQEYTVSNVVNRTVEFKVGRKYFSLAPRGKTGDVLTITQAERNHADFLNIEKARLFYVQEVK
jgi:hypothetical protein